MMLICFIMRVTIIRVFFDLLFPLPPLLSQVSQGTEIVIVRQGDTLSKILKARHLVHALKSVISHNRLNRNGNYLFVGQRLVIPGQQMKHSFMPIFVINAKFIGLSLVLGILPWKLSSRKKIFKRSSSPNGASHKNTQNRNENFKTDQKPHDGDRDRGSQSRDYDREPNSESNHSKSSSQYQNHYRSQFDIAIDRALNVLDLPITPRPDRIQIKSRRRQLAKKLHPDLGHPSGIKTMADVNAACAFLIKNL